MCIVWCVNISNLFSWVPPTYFLPYLLPSYRSFVQNNRSISLFFTFLFLTHFGRKRRYRRLTWIFILHWYLNILVNMSLVFITICKSASFLKMLSQDFWFSILKIIWDLFVNISGDTEKSFQTFCLKIFVLL